MNRQKSKKNCKMSHPNFLLKTIFKKAYHGHFMDKIDLELTKATHRHKRKLYLLVPLLILHSDIPSSAVDTHAKVFK